MQKTLTILLGMMLSACAALGQDFEQVNTTSPQTLSGPKTLTAPILTSPTITGTTSIGAGATLTTPTISAPTFSGTAFGNLTSLALTTPTLTSPIFSGSFAGTYNLAGTPTITAATLSGVFAGTYTFAGTPTLTSPTINSPTIATPTITGAALFGGTLRLPNNTYYLGRNAANNADLNLAKINAADQIEFGATVKNFSLDANPTTSLQPTTKQYVDAATTATFLSAQSNPIINGSLDVWQRGTTFVGAANAYTADRWYYARLLAVGAVTVNRSTNVPTVAQAGVLFNYSLEVDVTTIDASIGASDFYELRQTIEGYNWRPFAQRQFTVSFWAMSSKTGTHSFAVNNGGFDRSFVQTYTMNVADTWEYKSITVDASPSAGTWDYTNGGGAVLIWPLAAGSTVQTTAGTWQTGQFHATSAQVNVLDSTSNFFRITGVKLELGSVATPLQFRSFQDELKLCERYYQKSFLYATTPAQNVGAGTGEFRWPATFAGAVSGASNSYSLSTRMRGAITYNLYNPAAANFQVRNLTDAADLSASAVSGGGDTSFYVGYTGTAGTAVGEVLGVHWTAESEL